MASSVNDIKSLVLRLASPEEIHAWSRGEVTKPETINYRTQRPERDGLFDERIFGPIKDFECYCGKYRRVRYRGITCERCGVEVTRAAVRRERFGHIDLATPVSHIWFVRGVPSRIGLLLDIPVSELEKVIYFGGYIITNMHEKERASALRQIEEEFRVKTKSIDERQRGLLKEAFEQAKNELRSLRKYAVLNEVDYQRLSFKFSHVFEASIGAEALRALCADLDLAAIAASLEKEAKDASPVQVKKILSRLRLVNTLIRSNVRPEWMFLSVIPVIPPDLRPMVALEGGRHASSDINDLYRRVINRNNRLKRLFELKAPEVIVRNERRMLQEAVDALVDNSIRRGTAPAASQAQKRPLRSLADMLKGKQGRFRQNLLGKRVDYSGRSVIVVGPNLKLDQCGLPKKMALELFRPFVVERLLHYELVHNIRMAGKMIDEATPEVWALLEEVIADKYVLLNRAPTLHRLGIQAFRPILIEGKAIELHPLVCQAFNADFDGDQMAVHVPLTEEAQKEAAGIMASTHNLLKPGTAEPIVEPRHEMVLGCYWLTREIPGAAGEGKRFASKNEAVLAADNGFVDLHAKIVVGESALETTVGRILFNATLPDSFPFVNEELRKKNITAIVIQLLDLYGAAALPPVLDRIKNIGFQYATRSGTSWGMDDLIVPPQKGDIMKRAEEEVREVTNHYDQGLLSDEERYTKVVEIWSRVMKEIGELVPKALDPRSSPVSLVSSNARGSWGSTTQMSGMKGLVRNPAGRIIELPIRSSYKEGLSVLEYFIATHGARKGTADTALKTSVAGYLTRRLVDVAQDLVIQEADCGSEEGLHILQSDAEEVGIPFSKRLFGRVLLEDIKSDGKKLFKKGTLLSTKDAEAIEAAGIPAVTVRSPIRCKTSRGICQTCYGYDLAYNKLIALGEAVGIVAAQAIGEPGTQLTMRTFHTGGVAEEQGDITMGLPRVDEVLEVRGLKNKAVIAMAPGKIIDIKEDDQNRVITLALEKGTQEYTVFRDRLLLVKVGDELHAGDRLTIGAVDMRDLLKYAGKEAVERYILNEVSKVYVLQGATINPKHIEIIVKQMFSRVRVHTNGSTTFAISEMVDKYVLMEENKRVEAEGGEPATAGELLLGISRVALSTTSVLSAASFQETSRVLINAALAAKEDKLFGLKENVIVGRLIPAGTGFHKKGMPIAMEVEEEIEEPA
jgi:DNA-directed RNA polymerase subunit beta'